VWKELVKKCINIEGAAGTGARAMEDVEVAHGRLMAAGAATLRARLRSSLWRFARFDR
jgi:hypothetical protein